MQFYILSRPAAKRFSYASHDFTSVVISITDVGSEPNSFAKATGNGIKSILHLQFDDVERGGPNCITQTDVDQIIEFVRKHQNNVDAFIVHCEAGISRSSGVCAAIMKYLTGDDSALFGCSKYCPNMTCYMNVLCGFMDVTAEEEAKIKTKEAENLEAWKNAHCDD